VLDAGFAASEDGGGIKYFGADPSKPTGSRPVRSMQRELAADGFLQGPVDGRYGPQTDLDVRRFQAANGLSVDGTAHPTTIARVNAHTRLGPQRRTSGRRPRQQTSGGGPQRRTSGRGPQRRTTYIRSCARAPAIRSDVASAALFSPTRTGEDSPRQTGRSTSVSLLAGLIIAIAVALGAAVLAVSGESAAVGASSSSVPFSHLNGTAILWMLILSGLRRKLARGGTESDDRRKERMSWSARPDSSARGRRPRALPGWVGVTADIAA